MQGSGGMITADRAADKPIATLSSGPAAGAIAAAKIGAQAGLGDIVTFDVGGTSTDVSLIHGGKPFVTHAKQVEWGLHARVPMIDVESVGAGGGSIAWIDEGGGLKVGPQSAGANPGPICYGRGGDGADALGRAARRRAFSEPTSRVGACAWIADLRTPGIERSAPDSWARASTAW